MWNEFIKIWNHPEARHKFIVELIGVSVVTAIGLGIMYGMGLAKLAGWF